MTWTYLRIVLIVLVEVSHAAAYINVAFTGTNGRFVLDFIYYRWETYTINVRFIMWIIHKWILSLYKKSRDTYKYTLNSTVLRTRRLTRVSSVSRDPRRSNTGTHLSRSQPKARSRARLKNVVYQLRTSHCKVTNFSPFGG